MTEKTPRSPFRTIVAPTALVLFMLIFGCDDSVHPFVGENLPFTIWGYMDAGSDTQRVRVFTIEDRIGTDRPGPIDATVTSTNLTTGEQRVWTDSVVTFHDGTVGHVFWSPFRAAHEQRYRLEVARSDGAVTSAEVTLPPKSTVEVDRTWPNSRIPVSITGSVPNIVGLSVIYEAMPAFPANVWPDDGSVVAPAPVVLPVAIQYETPDRQGDLWRFAIDMPEDAAEVEFEYQRHCLPERVLLRSIEVRFLAADSSWAPPGGHFDLEDLIEPGVFSNVENGFGFFGAGETVSVRWLPPREVVTSAGFVLELPCPLSASPGCEVVWPCFRCDEALPRQVRQIYCML